jgi:hypothetical protein
LTALPGPAVLTGPAGSAVLTGPAGSAVLTGPAALARPAGLADLTALAGTTALTWLAGPAASARRPAGTRAGLVLSSAGPGRRIAVPPPVPDHRQLPAKLTMRAATPAHTT